MIEHSASIQPRTSPPKFWYESLTRCYYTHNTVAGFFLWSPGPAGVPLRGLPRPRAGSDRRSEPGLPGHRRSALLRTARRRKRHHVPASVVQYGVSEFSSFGFSGFSEFSEFSRFQRCKGVIPFRFRKQQQAGYLFCKNRARYRRERAFQCFLKAGCKIQYRTKKTPKVPAGRAAGLRFRRRSARSQERAGLAKGTLGAISGKRSLGVTNSYLLTGLERILAPEGR